MVSCALVGTPLSRDLSMTLHQSDIAHVPLRTYRLSSSSFLQCGKRWLIVWASLLVTGPVKKITPMRNVVPSTTISAVMKNEASRIGTDRYVEHSGPNVMTMYSLTVSQVLFDAADHSRFYTKNTCYKLVRQLIAGLRKNGMKPGDCVLVSSFNDVRPSRALLPAPNTSH